MTNKEMVQVLKRVRKHVIDVSEIDTVIAALESEPEPLAVKRGWLHPDDFYAFLHPDFFWDEGPLPPGRKDDGFVPVTVTITDRKE